jgi:hypothetical protein
MGRIALPRRGVRLAARPFLIGSAVVLPVAVLCLVAAAAGSTPRTAVAACKPRWKSASLPADQLNAIEALSSSDVWVVGSAGRRSFVARWNGDGWKVVPSPSPGRTFNVLYGVSGRSRDDVWAVGDVSSAGYTEHHALVEHWNGSRWTLVKSPDLDALASVDMLSRRDGWAAGFPSYSPLVIERWDGSAWRLSHPAKVAGYAELGSVAAVRREDVWAVGAQVNSPPFVSRPLIEHWNGGSWRVLASRGGGELLAVTALSPNDVWAVGDTAKDAGDRSLTRAQFWDGASWKVVPTPSPDRSLNQLAGVSAMSSMDVWAVGSYGLFDHRLVEHWDGQRWQIVRPPNVIGRLSAVAAISRNDVWMAGSGGYLVHYGC